MKILFLDVDNVLNSKTWFRRQPTPRRFSVDPKCCSRVMKICERTRCALIVSSSWRLRMKPRDLVRHLAAGGIQGDIVLGVTPHLLPHTFRDVGLTEDCEYPRGMEILEWLKIAERRGLGVEKFVILDDSDDMFNLSDHLVQTSPEVGISDADVEAAISHLT